MFLNPNEMEEVRREILHELAEVERLRHCGGTYSYLCDVNGSPTYTHNPIAGHVLAEVVHPHPPEVGTI